MKIGGLGKLGLLGLRTDEGAFQPSPFLSISPQNINLPLDGTAETVTISSNTTWSIL